SAYEEAKEVQEGLEAERTALQEQQAQTATELSSAKARAEALKLGTALEADLEDIVNADLPGVGAAVTERLSVTTGFEMAVAAALSTTVSGVIVDSGEVALSVLDHLGEDTNVSLTIPSGASARPSVQAGGEVGAPAAAGKGGHASDALPGPSGGAGCRGVEAGGEDAAPAAAGTAANASAAPPAPDAPRDPASLPGTAAEAGSRRWQRELGGSDVPELHSRRAQAPHAVV